MTGIQSGCCLYCVLEEWVGTAIKWLSKCYGLEMVYQLRVFAALAEELDSVPSTQMVAHSLLCSSFRDLVSSSSLHKHEAQADMQTKHIYT